MPLFGSRKYSYKTRQRTQGVDPAVRAARARKGHKRRAAHLFSGTGAKRGFKTTYRKPGRGSIL